MPKLLKAEIPLKTPSYHRLMPFAFIVSGILLFIYALSATHPRNCHRK